MFKGVGTALVTPFSNDAREINYESLKNLLNEQIEAKIDFIVLLGTTGEASTISFEEI